MITRRTFAIGTGAMGAAALFDARFSIGEHVRGGGHLPIPRLIDAARQDNVVKLRVAAGRHEFYRGKSAHTYGYSAPMLGPVIRLRRGDRVQMVVDNALEMPTTVHWHGLLVPGESDGGPQALIGPGSSWRPILAIDQPAATLWYHPHPHHDTARQTYMGLAGLIIVDDGSDSRLDLPHNFGVDDLPLIIQDRSLSPSGSLEYDAGELGTIYGVRGDTIIVNGAIAPVARVPAGLVRLRLLNGANAQNFELKFSDRRTFHVIGSDGGFVPQPVPVSVLRISPAERFEVLVDFSDARPVVLETGPDSAMGIFGTISTSGIDDDVPVMRFEPVATTGAIKGLPRQLAELETPNPAFAVHRRQFVLDNGICGQRMRTSGHADTPMLTGINGRAHDPSRIDAETRLGTTEIWEIVSVGMPHPFHVHGALFRVLSLNGEPPAPHLAGWKDVILVEDKAELLVSFTQPADRDHPFMYHCHILEHEDAGMTGQYTCS